MPAACPRRSVHLPLSPERRAFAQDSRRPVHATRRDLAHRDSRTRRAPRRDSTRDARRSRASGWRAANRTASCSAARGADGPESRDRRSSRARAARMRTAARPAPHCCAVAAPDCRRSRHNCRSRPARRRNLPPATARTQRARYCARYRAHARANDLPANERLRRNPAVKDRALQRSDQLRITRTVAIEIEVHGIGSIIADDGGAPWYQ